MVYEQCEIISSAYGTALYDKIWLVFHFFIILPDDKVIVFGINTTCVKPFTWNSSLGDKDGSSSHHQSN